MFWIAHHNVIICEISVLIESVIHNVLVVVMLIKSCARDLFKIKHFPISGCRKQTQSSYSLRNIPAKDKQVMYFPSC